MSNMASAIKSALPSHMKPAGSKEENGDATFERRHGKTRSHMVSIFFLKQLPRYHLFIIFRLDYRIRHRFLPPLPCVSPPTLGPAGLCENLATGNGLVPSNC